MSDKWEIVGKAKKTKLPVPSKDSISDKRVSAKKPTFEEILPKYALKNIHADNINKENKKPNGIKKAAKPSQPLQAAPPKVRGISVPRKLQTIEAAFEQFNADALYAEIEGMKANFPDNHLIWQKGLTSYLTSVLNVKSPPSLIDRQANYPFNIVPANVKAIIYNLLNETGTANIQYFFDQSLTTLAVDSFNNLNCIGHNILLQLIAFEWPSVCIQNLAKNAILRNSYQNRSSIGLSLLWALGQGGFKDLTVGCRVWQNIMVPVLEMKSCTKWVCEYVHRMLNYSTGDINLVQSEFFVIFDEFLLQRNGIPKDCQKLLNNSASILLSRYISSAPKLHNVFLTLFKRLSTTKSIVLEPALIECLVKESECFKVWKMHYRKNIVESKILLSYFARNWTNLPASIKQNSNLKDFLAYIHLQNDSFKHQDQQLEVEINQSIRMIQIDQYAPGFPLKIQEFSISLWKGICSTSSYVYHSSSDFFKTKVFVGNLSPENLGKALNQTQIAAAEYYSWFHKKVDAYAKIQ